MSEAKPTDAPAKPSGPKLFAIVLGKRTLGPCGACAFWNPQATKPQHATGACHFAPPVGQQRPLMKAIDPGCGSFVAAAPAAP